MLETDKELKRRRAEQENKRLLAEEDKENKEYKILKEEMRTGNE